MNLNKFTKAELISKLNKTKKIDNINKSILKQIKIYLSQFWDLILTFKDILVKLTLISFFLKIFKIYKLFRRLWLTLNTIVMTIFGISLMDNFGFEFIKNFLYEIKFISWNIIDYFSNTQFYQFLSNLFSEKEKEAPSSKTTHENSSISGITKDTGTNTKDTGQISQDNRRNDKIAEWLKPDIKEEIKEEITEEAFNYNKYLAIAGLLIASCLVWVYFDEIKTGGDSFVEWVKSFWPGNNPDNDPGGKARMKEKWEKAFNDMKSVDEEMDKLKKRIISDPSSSHIKTESSIDKYFPETSMTSPSLENLNEQAKESWSRTSSPTSSTSSNETIKPISESFTSSSNETVKAMTESTDSTQLVHEKLAQAAFYQTNWKNLIDPDTKGKIKIVEKLIRSKKPESLDSTRELAFNFVDILHTYNSYVKEIIDNKNIESQAVNVETMREISFQLRKWIIGNYTHIYGNKVNTIPIGSFKEIPDFINMRDFIK
jgi:hypothetical protein